ncbi:unnamed protein product [Prorocentrum cordatum]|uniref:Phospholipid/glycerol acyltransferase domain-containing protein n=1 Tax=Prorocentrum cordatum TaxID=2364126 RepID=A0ABN9RZX5_9DINO|nr:unnamed protein product [Polarella glacialis]
MLAAFLLYCLAHQQKRHVLYHSCRLFFRCTFNNMFFRSVEILGAENLPVHGPVILTGNHNNQFVDGVFLLANSHREISFMIAQKSWDRPFVGFLARVFNCIPVSRPQDVAFAGAGVIIADGSDVLRGQGTCFAAEVKPGDHLEIKGRPYKVQAVTSDSELQGVGKYKVLPKTDQSKMYDAVHKSLKEGKCLGIFPEGGSHDQTDLLPLKAGVARIALEAYTKHNVQVPIVPVGLNYFKGHHFGGRVVMEFGPPIHIPRDIYEQADRDKHGATDALLEMIYTGMRSTIVPTSNYKLLQTIYMVRRLYAEDGGKISTIRAMDLNRRFAVGIARIVDLVSSTDGANDADPDENRTLRRCESMGAVEDITIDPEEAQLYLEIKGDLENYMSDLKALGLRDHQVKQIRWWSPQDLISQLMLLLITLGLGGIPHVLINLPAMAIAGQLAVREQEKALKASTVKVAARDVLMSYKIMYVLMLTIILVLLSLPLYGFLGLKAAEHGVRTYADLFPICRRLLSHIGRGRYARRLESLPGQRSALQRKLFQVVKRLGPRLGDLYFAKIGCC